MNYKLNISNEKKQELGFKYSLEIGTYVYRFCCYKYNKRPILFGLIWVNNDDNEHRVHVDVLDSLGRSYAPYTDREYGISDVIKAIDGKFENKLKELGAKEIGHDNNRKRMRKVSVRNNKQRKQK